MQSSSRGLVTDTLQLAARHGLRLTDQLSFNEMGLDFRVAFGNDVRGHKWVLRIPRRADLLPRIKQEAKVLQFVKRHIPVQVPDWQVCTSDLIAYPMLLDPVALTFDAETYAVAWHIDKDAESFLESYAELLVALHASPLADAAAAGIRHSTPEAARQKFRADMERVKEDIGIGRDLETRLRKWLDADALWPTFSTLVHGDLYAGHVTADALSRVTGVIDWSESEISDPSIDFTGHLAAFDLKSLEKLIAVYERTGGRTWPTMIEQISNRLAAAPVKYGIFALTSKKEEHLATARSLLELEVS